MRPRQAARTAFEIDKPWTVVMIASVVSALAFGISVWIQLRAEVDPALFSYAVPGNALLEATIEAAITLVLSILSFPIGLFIWNRMLGFGSQASGVLAAVVASYGLMVLGSPVNEVATTALWAAGSAAADWLPVTVYLVASLLLSSVYFSETLSISFANALGYNFLATVVLGLIVVLPVIAITSIPILAGEAP